MECYDDNVNKYTTEKEWTTNVNKIIRVNIYNRGMINKINIFTNIIILHCSYTNLESLQGINKLTNLKELQCSNNQLRDVRNILFLRNLVEIDIELPEHIQLIINMNLIINERNMYYDEQNVHNSDVQQSLIKSIINLMNDL